jgi:hypothetical protein
VAREVRKANCNDGTRYCVTSSHPQTEQGLSSEQSGNVEQRGDEGRRLRTVAAILFRLILKDVGEKLGAWRCVRAMRMEDEG